LISDSDVTLAARTAYEAVRAYRNQTGKQDMLPWVDASGMKSAGYEQAVKDCAKGGHSPKMNVEEALINAVVTALIEWREANGDSTGTGR